MANSQKKAAREMAWREYRKAEEESQTGER
jgi:hypothetical protein